MKILTPLINNTFTKINPEPIIFLGNPKAGTTVISNLTALASDKTINYDVTFKAYLSDWQYPLTKILRKLKLTTNIYSYSYGMSLYDQQMSFYEFVQRKKSLFSSDIIKDPNFTFFYKELVNIFPNAKFVYIVRNPFDNIRSILNRLNIEGNLNQKSEIYQTKLASLKKELPTWARVLEGNYPPVSGTNYIENLSLRWNLGVDTYLKNLDNMFLVQYEDFMKNKMGYIHNLCDKLNLPVVSDISNKLNKQYQPKGKFNLDLYTFFGEDNIKVTIDLQKITFYYFLNSQNVIKKLP